MAAYYNPTQRRAKAYRKRFPFKKLLLESYRYYKRVPRLLKSALFAL
jgi:hypothetical protein